MANKMDLIRQALSSAESSVKQAKQLLSELERGSGQQHAPVSSGPRQQEPKKDPNEQIPGVVGVFDGESMVTQAGEKLPVPANYAAKSQIVVGDTLKQIDQNGEKRFKQIQRVKRLRTTGILTKKEGKLTVVAQEGRFRVIPVAVEHVGAVVGDEVAILVPEGNFNSGWAALVSADEKPPVAEKTVPVMESLVKPVVAKVSAPKSEEIEVMPSTEMPKEIPEGSRAEKTEPVAPVETEDSSDVGEEVAVIAPKPELAEEASETVIEPAPMKEEEPKKEVKSESKPITSDAGESVILTDEDLR